jgi:hypothetical protein
MPLFRPRTHYYARMAAFDNREELETAMTIDALPEVKHWVRNIVGGPNSYAIPCSGGNFYPDFVAELEDGRRFVIEMERCISNILIICDNIILFGAMC